MRPSGAFPFRSLSSISLKLDRESTLNSARLVRRKNRWEEIELTCRIYYRCDAADGKTSLSSGSLRWNEEPTSSSGIDKGSERSMERRELERETMLAIFSSRVSRRHRSFELELAVQEEEEEGKGGVSSNGRLTFRNSLLLNLSASNNQKAMLTGKTDGKLGVQRGYLMKYTNVRLSLFLFLPLESTRLVLTLVPSFSSNRSLTDTSLGGSFSITVLSLVSSSLHVSSASREAKLILCSPSRRRLPEPRGGEQSVSRIGSPQVRSDQGYFFDWIRRLVVWVGLEVP